MRTLDKYNFLLVSTTLDGMQSQSYSVHPAFSSFAITETKDNKSWVYKRSTDCAMTFMGEDAEIIISSSVFTKYEIIMTDNRGVEVVRLVFKKTDCEIDDNPTHKTVKVTPNVYDPSKLLGDGVDNEYNLVDIIPADYKKTIGFTVKPTVQRYIYTVGGGDSEIHLFGTGGAYKASVTPAMDTLFMDSGKFGYKLCFTAYCDQVGHSSLNKYKGYYASTCRQYVDADGHMHMPQTAVAYNSNKCALSLRASEFISGYVQFYIVLYDENGVSKSSVGDFDLPSLLSQSQLWFTITGYGVVFTVRVYAVFGRVLNNVSGTALTDNDIYPAAYLYSKPCWNDAVTCSNRSSTDTGYGRIGNTAYYYAPPDNVQQWIPAYRESWHNGLSLWILSSPITDGMIGEENGVSLYSSHETIPDFYKLTDVIRHLLAQIDGSIIFTDDNNHSQFLTATTNPITGLKQGCLYMTQKSNLLNYHYDYPAWKAPCKLSQIFTLLENAFNCRYDIYVDDEGEKHLRIEHVTFYLNGYSYNTSAMSTINLKQLFDGRNGKPFSFLTKKWKYKTDSQPVRYEYSWMDTQSEAFAGFPIVVPEECRIFTDEINESRAIDWFSTDFDFLLSVPSECSSDGFVLAQTQDMDSLEVSNDDVIMYKDTICVAQNGRLAFTWLHPNFMPYGMYAERLLINDGSMDVAVRLKAAITYNEVSFITDGIIVTPMNLIMTECGSGIIEKLTYDLTSQKYTATLIYDIR